MCVLNSKVYSRYTPELWKLVYALSMDQLRSKLRPKMDRNSVQSRPIVTCLDGISPQLSRDVWDNASFYHRRITLIRIEQDRKWSVKSQPSTLPAVWKSVINHVKILLADIIRYPTRTGDIKEPLITTGLFFTTGLTNYKCLLSEYECGKFTGVFYE